jgi:hypothetical protein
MKRIIPDYYILIGIKNKKVVGYDYSNILLDEEKVLTAQQVKQKFTKYLRQAQKMVDGIK